MEKTTKAVRQGDVLLVPVEKELKGSKLGRDQNERIVLAYGERTGHAHALREKEVTAFQIETPEDEALAGLPKVDYILVGGSGAALKHEYADGRPAEHEPIMLSPGAYQVAAQVEYRPEALRRVDD